MTLFVFCAYYEAFSSFHLQTSENSSGIVVRSRLLFSQTLSDFIKNKPVQAKKRASLLAKCYAAFADPSALRPLTPLAKMDEANALISSILAKNIFRRHTYYRTRGLS